MVGDPVRTILNSSTALLLCIELLAASSFVFFCNLIEVSICWQLSILAVNCRPFWNPKSLLVNRKMESKYSCFYTKVQTHEVDEQRKRNKPLDLISEVSRDAGKAYECLAWNTLLYSTDITWIHQHLVRHISYRTYRYFWSGVRHTRISSFASSDTFGDLGSVGKWTYTPPTATKCDKS